MRYCSRWNEAWIFSASAPYTNRPDSSTVSSLNDPVQLSCRILAVFKAYEHMLLVKNFLMATAQSWNVYAATSASSAALPRFTTGEAAPWCSAVPPSPSTVCSHMALPNPYRWPSPGIQGIVFSLMLRFGQSLTSLCRDCSPV